MVKYSLPVGLLLMGIVLISTFTYPVQGTGTSIRPNIALDSPTYEEAAAFFSNFTAPSATFRTDPEYFTASRMLEGRGFWNPSAEEEPIYGVVAINTEKGQTVVCTDQLGPASTNVNFMDIDVSKVIVIAINTARGGNAIANSEIVIRPTQNGSREIA